MERSRKLALTNWTKANDALNLHFEGNKSKLATHLKKKSRTTITAFFSQESLSEPEFRKICFALRLNWQEVSAVETLAPTQSENDQIEQVRSRCCKKILYQHSTIQLLNQTEIGVDQLYVDVWLLDRSPRTFQVSESTLLKSFDLRNDRLGLGDRVKRNEGMAVAHANARLLILGKPGAGKTTFLKHLAVDCSNDKFQPKLIPVLIELRKIRSMGWNLLDALSEELGVDNQRTQTLLEQGRLLILMDGLDEVPTNSFRRNVQEQLQSLAQEPKHSGNRFILTCRTQIIEMIPQGFNSVEVADFNDEQVKKFVENWFCASGRNEAEIAQHWQAFSDATKKNPSLNELTVTPVLLSLMCLVLQDAGELPSQTASLYRKGIRLLLEKWNDRKDIAEWEIGKEVYRKLSIDQKEALLIEIAARKFENPGNFVLFEQQDLAQQIANFLKLVDAQEGEAVLKAIEAQHGLLVERADELWSFSHLTFQEHFTIQWLTKLSPEQLAEKIADKRWQEIVKLAVESQQPADRLLRLIKQAIDHSVLQDAKLQEFLTWIQSKTESTKVDYKSAAIRALYFAFTLDFSCNFSLDYALEFSLDHALELTLNHDLEFAVDLTLAHSLALVRVLNHALGIAPDFEVDPDLDLYLNRPLTRAHTRAYALDPILANKLEKLRIQLLEHVGQDSGSLKRWWNCSSHKWVAELRQTMIEHRNIGHDWQFTKLQEQALQRYYDANRFLIELLKKPGAVTDTVRQEIEDNLLLPIAELKRRSPDQYS
ncbi:NACHT domain-containing protein [Phormidesmis priestleyi]|uniref:NACHT domain-containing protein n=1 Tax=Phormidesmis priestleyi TaxID=268141 RepID=UPI000839DC46|nr:NACHT domain-containing protein [Phormidesmis priestleyi]